MYKLIAEALKDKGITDVHPTRYLRLFCPVKRETAEGAPEMTPAPLNTAAANLQKTRRFMTYGKGSGSGWHRQPRSCADPCICFI